VFRKVPTAISLRFGAVLGLFLAFAGDGLRVYFSPDDLMNLALYVRKGWGEALGIVLFWQSRFYRPVGGVAYLALYSVFGFHAAGFRAAMLLLMCANLALAWRIAAMALEDSRLGLLAILLIAYRATSNGLYYNFGTVYDVLCFTFMLSALALWLKVRRANRFPGVKESLLLLALYLAALGSKEMAIALPVLLLLREALWGRLWSRTAPRPEWRAIPVIGAFAVIAAVFIAGKTGGAESLAANPAYRPVFTLHAYLAAMARYLNALFYTETFHASGERLFRSGITVWFLCGGLAVAALLRLRAMAFGWLWFIVCLLPVSFIQPRMGFVLYIPALGLAIAVVDLLRRAYSAASKHLAASARRYCHPAGAPMFVLVLVCLVPIHWHFKRIYDPGLKRAPAVFESFAADLARAGWSSQGSSVLYLWDPLPEHAYNALFLTSLLRRDPAVKVGRARANQALFSPAVAAAYAEVFDFRDGHLRRLASPDLPAALERLRAARGYIDPVSGFYLKLEDWPRWWTQREFSLTAACPAPQPQCRLTVTFLMPIGPFDNGERRIVSIDIAGAHWRDVPILAGADFPSIAVPLPPGQATPVRFRLDRAIDPSRFPGDPRQRAIVVSGLQVWYENDTAPEPAGLP